MTMPYLSDINDYEWTWVDYLTIIFNLCVWLIFGWETMVCVSIISIIGFGLFLFCLLVFWMCMRCSRQLVINLISY
jgi:hypothetical protein